MEHVVDIASIVAYVNDLDFGPDGRSCPGTLPILSRLTLLLAYVRISNLNTIVLSGATRRIRIFT